MELPFAKYEGIGNDFIVVRGRDAITPTQAVALCDRHLGIGADGVLLTGVENGRPYMDVINADGSTPQMCGNGLRCVALDLHRRGDVNGDAFAVETPAGSHPCMVFENAVAVTMRAPSFQPDDVPVVADAPLLDAPWTVGDETIRVTAVTMGNPHLVTFDEVGERRRDLGPALQNDERLPEAANVGFARYERQPREGASDQVVLHLRVLERGAGWTRACGTGACAAAAAAVATGRARAGDPIQVRLPGGALTITQNVQSGHLVMTGPARHVFDGTVDLGRLRAEP